jgi:hypothetical protein
MVAAYEKYANAKQLRVTISSVTYDKIISLLTELEEGGSIRARQLRAELSWTLCDQLRGRVTGAD